MLLGSYVYFYLLVYLMLFNSVDYSQMIVCDELERMWKKEVMVEFKIQYWNLHSGTEEKNKIKSVDSWSVG